MATTKIQREIFSGGEETILNSRYRVRLLSSVDVPILCNLQSLVGSEVLIVDLPQAEGLEQKYFDGEKSRLKKAGKRDASAFDMDKENIVPEGCTIAGDPLEVSFLTIEKLEKLSKKKSHANYDNVQLIEHTPFKTHLMAPTEALDLLNDLKDAFDDSLASLTQVVLADASSCQNLLFLARQRSSKQIVDYKATFMGNLKAAVGELNLMTAQLQVLQMRRCVCRCRFDVLREMMIFQRSTDFVPAFFDIQAEWAVQLPKSRIQRKVIPFENLLAMPPDNAKVVVKFKPGWMDERVVLTNNIYELKHLADLALSLKAGQIPWKVVDSETSTDADDEQSEFLLQRVSELIERARDKPDIESVYPFDFTDRLWDIIRTVKSTETLKKAFEMIYSELRTGEFRVMVEKDKESSLAKMLRVRSLGDMVFPRLEPLTCLQMLVEIGVDRFKGDIQHRFIKSEFITNITELEPFFLHSSAPVEERIEQLMPLYLALQSMLMIEKFVRLTPHKKMLMAKRLLGHFTAVKNIDSNTKEFSFEACMEDIHRDSLKPCMTEWLIERIYEKQMRVIGGSSATPGKSSSAGSGTIHEIAFLSKYVGFAHIAPVSHEEGQLEFSSACKSLNAVPKRVLSSIQPPALASVKGEVFSAANTPSPMASKMAAPTILPPTVERGGDASGVTEETEEGSGAAADELDEQMLFDCVRIVATTNTLTAFGIGACGVGGSSKSPASAMLSGKS